MLWISVICNKYLLKIWYCPRVVLLPSWFSPLKCCYFYVYLNVLWCSVTCTTVLIMDLLRHFQIEYDYFQTGLSIKYGEMTKKIIQLNLFYRCLENLLCYSGQCSTLKNVWLAVWKTSTRLLLGPTSFSRFKMQQHLSMSALFYHCYITLDTC